MDATPVHPPLLELPTQQPREQSDPAPVQARKEREVETEAREGVDTTREGNHEERSTGPPDPARTPSTPVTVSEKADRPRKETRRPARYDDFECYTLQPQKTHTDIEGKNYLPPMMEETYTKQQRRARSKEYLEEKTRKNKSKELFFCTQEGPLVYEFTPETAPFCSCASPFCSCALTSKEVDRDQEHFSDKSALIFTDLLEMDKKNSVPPAKDNEVTLKELLEEVAMLETATSTSEKRHGGCLKKACWVKLI